MAVRTKRAQWIQTGIIVAVIAIVAGGAIYWMESAGQVYIDAASIAAPEIALAPTTGGTLEEIYVQPGDEVNANATVARVGNELVKTTVAGDIISIEQKIGAEIAPGTPVVTMIDPTQLRVVGKVDENKGLSELKVGDPVTFTVDAYGGQKFSGVLDAIAPTSEQTGIIFNISDKRQTQQFDVKARFDTSAYPFLKNGMSARMWVYTAQ